MEYVFGKQDFETVSQIQKCSVLLPNGLGGYAGISAGFSVPRCDAGILISAIRAPNERVTLVHWLEETLTVGEKKHILSTQGFVPQRERAEGLRNLDSFAYTHTPCWQYRTEGVLVERRLGMAWGENAAAVVYRVENRSGKPAQLEIFPYLKFAPKEDALEKPTGRFRLSGNRVESQGHRLYIQTDGTLSPCPERWECLAYPEDEKDGRPGFGYAVRCCSVVKSIPAGETVSFSILFSGEETSLTAAEILSRQESRGAERENDGSFTMPLPKALAKAADAFIVRRDSTGGKTILAGYPLFSDWGRDTMVALPGICLATGRYSDCKSILRTFLHYEKDGLVPNLFPEGGQAPMYNTVDAALLLIDGVWKYIRRTGDNAFLEEAYPVLERIVNAYRAGTHHGIRMDTDGLISAGEGLDQVTWMDVCVNGILPTPRHGKPVEVNAYWYNALKILESFSQTLGKVRDYGTLAEKVRDSFVSRFYRPEAGCLKDVLSGTQAEDQIRCNQIWAVSMEFSMLSPEQERSVVETVYRHLYTPCGLRSLSPEDPEYHGSYGGSQVQRDMAYHQGTVWVFPLGAYYRAYLKTRGNSLQAAEQVRRDLQAIAPMLRQGCLGQLPEIYSGDYPGEGQGCFAQAWSVGEILSVYEILRKIETAGESYDQSRVG